MAGGRARKTFEQHAETAGLEPPPRGKLEGYATDVLAQIPRLRADCGDGDEGTLTALTEMQAAAAGLLAYIEGEQARPSRTTRRPARTAKTPQVPAVTQLAARAAARRAAVRGRR